MQCTADLVLVAVGVHPETALAQTAGVALGVQVAICVSRQLATSVPHIYAAGDYIENWHRLLQRPTYLPLGTTAHKQGRIGVENAIGSQHIFAGTLGTQGVKDFDLACERSGLTEVEACATGYTPYTKELIPRNWSVGITNATSLAPKNCTSASSGSQQWSPFRSTNRWTVAGEGRQAY